MTPERWNKIKDLLATALEVAPEDRAPFLAQHYAGDDLLRRDLEILRSIAFLLRFESHSRATQLSV